MKIRKPLINIVLPLLLSACNLPFEVAAGSESQLSTQVAQTMTALAANDPSTTTTTPAGEGLSATPTVTFTPAPQAATSTSLPCNMASFVDDVTIPDDTNITVNQGFTKTWKLKNVGSCTWTSGYQIIFDSGDQMGGPNSQQLTNGTVEPNGTIDVSVDLVAPGAPGTYKGNWKLKEPGGNTFGLSTGPFWVQIKAVAVAPINWPNVQNGDSGVEVYAIQSLLKARGFNLAIDGKFGPITESKVKELQDQKGLAKDGIVGPQTWQALIIQVAIGSNGPEVSAVQKLLKDKFGYNIAVDGAFGPATNGAVKDFQSNNGLTVDGIVGPNTWKQLISK